MDWVEGLKLLLRKGASTSQATGFALRDGNLRLFKLLLSTDQFLFEPNALAYATNDKPSSASWPNNVWEGSSSILSGVLRFPRRSKAILQLVCETCAKARLKLMDRAKNHFSKSQLMDFGWNDSHFNDHLIDSAALKTYSQLRSREVALDMRLWPGTTRTIYVDESMTVDVAEILWASDFHEVDEFDDLGRTPLSRYTLLTDLRRNRQFFEMLLWFINHGAKTMVFSRMNNATFVHILASSLGHTSNKEFCDKDDFLRVVLDKACSLLRAVPRDSCRCLCSPNGCSPIQSLLRESPHRRSIMINWRYQIPFARKRQLLDLWHRHCPELLVKEENYTDLCRVEIFERLAMRHTCCDLLEYNSLGDMESVEMGMKLASGLVPEDQRAHAENELLRTKLEGVMSIYEELTATYYNDFDELWETWWKVVQAYVPARSQMPRSFSQWGHHGERGDGSSGAPLFTDDLEDVLQDIRRHVVRSMEIPIVEEGSALGWLVERRGLGFGI